MSKISNRLDQNKTTVDSVDKDYKGRNFNELTGALVFAEGNTYENYGEEWFDDNGNRFINYYLNKYNDIDSEEIRSRIFSGKENFSDEAIKDSFIFLFLSCNDETMKKQLMTILFCDDIIHNFDKNELTLIGIYACISHLFPYASLIFEYLLKTEPYNDIIVFYGTVKSYIELGGVSENKLISRTMESYKDLFEAGDISDNKAYLIYRYLGNYYNRFNKELGHKYYLKGKEYNDSGCIFNLGFSSFQNQKYIEALQYFNLGFNVFQDKHCAYGCSMVYEATGDEIMYEFYLKRAFLLGYNFAGNKLLKVYENKANTSKTYKDRGLYLIKKLVELGVYKFSSSHSIFYDKLVESGNKASGEINNIKHFQTFRELSLINGNLDYAYQYFVILKNVIDSIVNGRIDKKISLQISRLYNDVNDKISMGEFMVFFEDEIVRFSSLVFSDHEDGLKKVYSIIGDIYLILGNKEKYRKYKGVEYNVSDVFIDGTYQSIN